MHGIALPSTAVAVTMGSPNLSPHPLAVVVYAFSLSLSDPLTMARCRHYDNVAAVAPPSPPSVNGGAPRRPKRRRVEDDDDVVSALPDDILIGGIVSRLTIRDAAATGAVSARWRHLWKHAPRISLRPTHLTGGDVSSSRDYAQADRLAAAASSVLRHHRGAAGVVEMLVLALPLTPSRHAAVLGQSVEFAASSRTQELHLSLAAGGEHPYDFPQHWRFAGGRLRRLVLSDLNNNEGASSADAAPPHPRRAWREHVASVASLLVAAPFVKELRVEAYGVLPVPPPSKQMIQWPKHCSPRMLESIVVGGFSGEPELMELAFFLLRKSPAIKTLTVDTHRRHFRSNDRGWTREETEDPRRFVEAFGAQDPHPVRVRVQRPKYRYTLTIVIEAHRHAPRGERPPAAPPCPKVKQLFMQVFKGSSNKAGDLRA
ncbi:hypothetical protein HU200_028080 [Digitaria exilis]|uniref:F-box domain-containing protein n=1 Tax=Digitaria exilis TaxID=1010633 RepID=A0A835BVR0_9POAL|nr:hypothetical protein HU200_028080 [Digitaria exilis]